MVSYFKKLRIFMITVHYLKKCWIKNKNLAVCKYFKKKN